MPRGKTSMPRRAKPISRRPASRIASRCFSRRASASASSSPLGSSSALFGRQQQPRFQVSEPRRHDEVVGGELDPQPARRLDESEVLLGERQDRDLCEIDLLVARKLEQKVERTFEAGDVDDKTLVGADDRRLEIG